MNAAPNASPMIRTFRARDAIAALGAVKAAFGPDAVILETKQVGGGLFGRAQIEVTAAASEPTGSPRTREERMENDMASLRRVVDDLRSSLRRGEGPARKLDDLRAGDPGVDLLGDLREVARGGRGGGGRELGVDARRVLAHLVDRGVDADQARALLEDAVAAGGERAHEIYPQVAAAVGRKLLAAPAPWSADARRTVALIGPTGVGKTTAIAKIAARALLETRFKIGLITVDTYRVGASDQLARYGKIMSVPTYVARDRAGLADAINRTGDEDLVLIDTAGRSDAESMAAQIDLIKTAPNVQLQLVLSAAAGPRDLAGVARRYKGFAPERLIFTKLDEAEGPAGVLSAHAVINRPVSCVCDGQRVPEDIHPVTEETLLEKLLAPPAAFLSSSASGRFGSSTRKEQLRGSSR